ncbi:preprotein translocase subunit SecE [Buchnera aphidicola (Kurisakia onigurumii)]|uniref:preprotein translocase subunit SecE n=1 Tax=Buchnera aphidicola TaxID=9 RepID=UPI0031B696EA
MKKKNKFKKKYFDFFFNKKNYIIYLIALTFFSYFYIKNNLYRNMCNIILIIFIVYIFSLTNLGIRFLSFLQEIKYESKKVVFPNHKYTFQTTIVVIFMIIIASMILWILDRIIFNIISYIIKLRI